MHESILLLLPPPACIARTIAVLLHVYCAIYDPPSTSLWYAIHHTKLVITISQYRVKPNHRASRRSSSQGLLEEGAVQERCTHHSVLPFSSKYSKRYPQGSPPVHTDHSSITLHTRRVTPLPHSAETRPSDCFLFCAWTHLEITSR